MAGLGVLGGVAASVGAATPLPAPRLCAAGVHGQGEGQAGGGAP